METHYRLEEQQLVIKVANTEGKSWVRVIFPTGSSFADKTRSRSSKGALVDTYNIEPGMTLQASDGFEKKYYHINADGSLTEFPAYKLERYVPTPQKIKITLEFDETQSDLIEEILKKVSK